MFGCVGHFCELESSRALLRRSTSLHTALSLIMKRPSLPSAVAYLALAGLLAETRLELASLRASESERRTLLEGDGGQSFVTKEQMEANKMRLARPKLRAKPRAKSKTGGDSGAAMAADRRRRTMTLHQGWWRCPSGCGADRLARL